MVVCDPKGERIGSGGATMRALFKLEESIAWTQCKGDRVAARNKVKGMKIGIFHSGGDSQRLPTCSVRGKAFCSLPVSRSTIPTATNQTHAAAAAAGPADHSEHSTANTGESSSSSTAQYECAPLDFLFLIASRLLDGSGLIVVATDVLLDLPPSYPLIRSDSVESKGVVGCAVPAPVQLGTKHGVFVPDEKQKELHNGGASTGGSIRAVRHILQKASEEALREAGSIDAHNQSVMLDAGVIYFPPDAVGHFLQLAAEDPFRSCCVDPSPFPLAHDPVLPLGASMHPRTGMDDTGRPIRFELYTDCLLPMNPSMTFDDYLNSPPPDARTDAHRLRQTRTRLWQVLHPLTCYVACHTQAKFYHLGTQQERMELMFAPHHQAWREQHGVCLQAHAAWTDDSAQQARRSAQAGVLNSLFVSGDDTSAYPVRLRLDRARDVSSSLPSPSSPSPSPPSPSPFPSLCPGSYVEHSILSGGSVVSSGAFVSGLRTPSLGHDLTVPPGICMQETQLSHTWVDCLQQQDRCMQLSRRRYLAYPPKSIRGSPPLPTVLSVFHSADPIKTPLSNVNARYLNRPFQGLLESIAHHMQMGMDELIRRVWPGVRNDKDRTLWNAKLFAVIQRSSSISRSAAEDDDISLTEWTDTNHGFDSDPELSLWLLRLAPQQVDTDSASSSSSSTGSSSPSFPHLPHRDVLASWLSVCRMSFKDILQHANSREDSCWRSKLSARIDRVKLTNHITQAWANGKHSKLEHGGSQGSESESESSAGIDLSFSSPPSLASGGSFISDLLDRFRSSFRLDPSQRVLHPLMYTLDGWLTRSWHRQTQLDVVTRIVWIQRQIVNIVIQICMDEKYVEEGYECDKGMPDTGRSFRSRLVLRYLHQCQPSNFPRLLPRALTWLRHERDQLLRPAPDGYFRLMDEKEIGLVKEMLNTYDEAIRTIIRCAANTPRDLNFTLPPYATSASSSSSPSPSSTEVIDDASLSSSSLSVVPLGSTVRLRSCVRLDLFGGWGDTPPICYERGGRVINVALNIDDQLPLEVNGRVTLLENTQTDMDTSESSSANGHDSESVAGIIVQLGEVGESDSQRVVLSSLSDLADYDQPTSPAALIKCALLAMELVRLERDDANENDEQDRPMPDLTTQLTEAYWTHKPQSCRPNASSPDHPLPRIRLHLQSLIHLRGSIRQGTGLGVSSILAAALVQLLARIFDRCYTRTSIAMLVLRIEQMLSTGGGWQDQVGALWPGMKSTRSAPGLPLTLQVKPIPMSAAQLREFSAHCICIHTGLPRLARNLLRAVLNKWHCRTSSIMHVFDALEYGCDELEAALMQSDWVRVGSLISRYWRIKRWLATDETEEGAPPAEPDHVRTFLERIQGLYYGATLAGAGGGGFLVVFAAPSKHSLIMQQIEQFNQEQRTAAAGAAAAAATSNHSAESSFDVAQYTTYRASVCIEEGSQYEITIKP